MLIFVINTIKLGGLGHYGGRDHTQTCYVSHKVWNFREDGTNRFIFNGKIGAPVVKLIQKT